MDDELLSLESDSANLFASLTSGMLLSAVWLAAIAAVLAVGSQKLPHLLVQCVSPWARRLRSLDVAIILLTALRGFREAIHYSAVYLVELI